MTIHLGDCIEVMRGMEADSVDAVVTDPPYGLEFMGKGWDKFGVGGKAARPDNQRPTDENGDSTGLARWDIDRPQTYTAGTPFQAWCEAWGREALRVTKPGGYLLAFGGTRTHHRLVCGLEDAGWIIRDELDWVHAQGFPKGKANLKPAHEPIVLARKPGPLRPLGIDAARIGTADGHGGGATASDSGWFGDEPYEKGSGFVASQVGRWPSNVLLSDPALFDEPNPYVVGSGATATSGGRDWIGDGTEELAPGWRGMEGRTDPHRRSSAYHREGDSGGYSRFFIVPKADRTDREPIVRDAAVLLHRARGECDKLGPWESPVQSPSEQTDSTSPERDISDVPPLTADKDSSSDTSLPGKPPMAPSRSDTRFTTSTGTSKTTDSPTSSSLTPSPTSASTPVASSETASGGSPAKSAGNTSQSTPSTGISPERVGPSTEGVAPATSARLSKQRRCAACGKPLPRVGVHPTTKPTDLMRHLVRLVTPPGGTVLDCFAGSGSTAIAAELEGFPWIGIEKEPEYVAIAEARLNGTQRGLGLDVPAPTPTRKVAANKTTERPNRSAAAQGFNGPWKGTGNLADSEDVA